MRVSIIGLGYVGLPLGMALSDVGVSVQGVDINSDLVERLISQISPGATLTISSDYSQIQESEIIIICVPTPLRANHSMDLTFLEDAVRKVTQFCKPESTIIIESTSYVGSLRNFVFPILQQSGKNLRCGVAPERIDPGNAEWNIKNTPRLVSGLDADTTQVIFDLYSSVCESVVKVSSPEIAEAAKLYENTFRLVNIALSMEVATLLNEEGVDFIEVLNAASTKSFGFMPFFPSLAIGGHCIPVDPVYLNSSFAKNPQGSTLITNALEVNRSRVAKMKLRLENEGLINRFNSIQILGLGYKANSIDTRESAAVALMNLLRQEGYEVKWHDPILGEFEGEKSSEIDFQAGTWVIGAWNRGFQDYRFSEYPGKLLTFSVLPSNVAIGATTIL